MALTLPYNENKYVQNVYNVPGSGYGHDNPYVCQVFSKKEINTWIKENNGKILRQEYWQVFNGDLWTCGKRIYPPRQVNQNELYQMCCFLIQKEN